MRLEGAQLRFVTLTLVCWMGFRLINVVDGVPATGPAADGRWHAPWPTPAAHEVFTPAQPPAPALDPSGFRTTVAVAGARRARPVRQAIPEPFAAHPALAPPEMESEQRAVMVPVAANDAPFQPPATLASPNGRRWSGSAYLFVREGDGRTLASGGLLGGSQAGARMAYAVTPEVAVAARLYAPLRGKGAEAAVGLDWRPIANVAARASVERRVGLDRAGRDAWSAYVAGGFYHESRGVIVDGYGQTGFVGLQRRDGFVDGALRGGMRLGRLVAGGGMWGAAQPGASRLDVGPRIAASLPVGGASLTLAIEGRMRVAGNARPGSGAAATLAADF